MANNDDRDNWKVHFADTMRGGQYVNNWRMAELHAKEAPDRVRELEAWGAVFDRTPDGRINQRNFGGHRYPRLAHVGDRTGLELIRTLQDHTVYLGVTVHMEHTVIALLLDGGRAAGVLAYDRERGRFHVFTAKAVILATGGVGRAYKITSNSWEGTGDGHALAYRAGAELIDMEFIQFHPTGMVWPPSVKGILVTEGVRGEGGVLKNSEGRRFMFDDIPDNYKPQTASDRRRGLALHAGRQERAASAGAADARPRRALHQPRGEGRPRLSARRRLPRHRLDQGEAPGRRGAHQAQAAEHVPPVQGAGRPRHHEGADGSRPDDALHHGRHPRRRRHADVDHPRPVRRRRVRVGHQRRQPPRRQLAVGPDRLRQARRRVRGRVRAAERRRHASTTARSSAAMQRRRSRRSSAATAARTPTRCRRTCRTRCRPSSASSALEDEMQEALDAASQGFKERAARVGVVGPPRVQHRLAHGARPAQPADGVRGDHALGDRAQGEPRRPLPRGLSRTRSPSSARSTSWCKQRRRRLDAGVARAAAADAGPT